MKLHPFHRVFPVAKAHDFPLGRLRRDLQASRQTLPFDQQAVVAGRLERIRQIPKEGPPIVPDPRGLPVHEPSGSDNPPAERGADALVAETHPQDGNPARKMGDDIARDSRFPGGTGAGGNHDPRRAAVLQLLQGDLVVPDHIDTFTEFREVLHQIVGEGILIVDDQHHRASRVISD